MITFAIIDDEPIAHRIIEGYCSGLNHLQNVGNCYNAMEAIELLHREKVDLIFLDIKMPKVSGFEFLRSLPRPPKTIVTSAFKDHAIEGYELEIIDYLLKPFSFERFAKAINKVTVSQPTTRLTEPITDHIFIKGDKRVHQIGLDLILFIEAFGNYSKVHLPDTTITTPERISGFEKTLPLSLFMRVHKSYIVARHKIDEIAGNRLKIAESEIPIGQTYKHSVSNWLKL